MKKELKVKLDFTSIAKFGLVSFGVFIMIFFMMDEFLEYDKQVMIFVPRVFLFVVFSIILYLGITYLIDANTKNLFKSIFQELRH